MRKHKNIFSIKWSISLAKLKSLEYSILTHFFERGLLALVLGFIGAGNMATAILDGVVKNCIFMPSDIIISNPHEDKLKHAMNLGVSVTTNNRDVVNAADIIVLAVKPQMFHDVMSGICDISANKCFVSIAAGISSRWISEQLPGNHVIRVMPNTPLQVGVGATSIAVSPGVPDDLFQIVCNVFSAAGEIAVVSEDLIDAMIPVNGSSPAFFFRMADVMVRWAQEQGIDSDVALKMAACTMKGAAEMLLRAGKSAEELTRQVCSPGGTTLAALSIFDEQNFDDLLKSAMTKCLQRSKELGK